MVRIRRFGVARTSTVFALWTMVFGLLLWIPFALIILAAGDFTTTDQFGRVSTIGAGPAIVFFLIGVAIYAGVIWIFSAIGLLIYNLVAGWVGGVEVQLVSVQPPRAPEAWQAPRPPGEYPTQQAQAPSGWNQPPTG